MDSTHKSHLDDAQKKLHAFRSHLDLLVRGVCESKNVNPSEILAAVSELQSLVQWVAQQPDLGSESAVLLGQLQELHRMQQNLENSPTEVENPHVPDSDPEQENKLFQESESYSKGLLDFSDIVSSNLSENNGELDQEEKSIQPTNMSLYHDSEFFASTAEANVVFLTNSDALKDIVKTAESESLAVKNEYETNINNEDHNSESIKEPILTNDIDIKDMFSNDSELFVKNNGDNKDLVSNDSEVLTKSLIEDLLSSDIEAVSENITEIKHLDSNNFQMFIKSDIEIKDLVSSDINVIQKHVTQFKGLNSIDIEASTESNIEKEDLQLSDTENFVKTNTELQDLLSSDTDITEKNNTVIQDLISSDAEVFEMTETEIFDFCTSDTEAPEKTNIGIQDLLSSDNKVLTNSNMEKEGFFSRDTASNTPNSLRNDVIILETNEDDKTTEWIGDTKRSDPLDICMFAIRNLYDSLRVKENELLKLSVMQNDQKHIEALQNVIIDFHKDITNLHSELDKTKKDNSLLKEQVLELEESENDARLEAQKLEQKLVFLQEKDSHSQSEICQLKQSLKKSTGKLSEKELTEKGMRSQIKYMETLVQKYEDQIKAVEAKEIAASKKEHDDKEKCQIRENTAIIEKPVTSEKGSQTYPFQMKIDHFNEIPHKNSNNAKCDSTLSQVTSKEKLIHLETDVKHTLASQNPPISASVASNIKEQFVLGEIDSISQKELMERLHKLMAEDAGLQQQIHNVDQINLDLWKKLQNLENNIGDCKRKDINETDLSVDENEVCGLKDSDADTKTVESSTIIQSKNIPEENIISPDQNEQYIKERVTKLEEISVSFENELKTRDNIYKEKEKKYSEWMETERRLMCDLKRLANEKDSFMNQVVNLKKEKEELEARVVQQQAELDALKDKNQKEIVKIRIEQEAMTMQLHHKVNQLITKEKDLLRMITKLKSERIKNQDKTELERLKCNYIELQLELSKSREDIRKLEDGFQIRLDECVSRHLQEESRLANELERLRNEKSRCDNMISDLQLKQHHLLQTLERQEKELLLTRECYKKSLEETEEVHRSVEIGLKSQLEKMEEVTVIATTALMEERMRVEKELQDNIKDLKTKEELYKAKIAELERDVNHLHEELHKVSEESESQEQSGEKQTDISNESTTLTPVLNYLQNNSQPLYQSQVPDTELKQSPRTTAIGASMTEAKKRESGSYVEAEKKVPEKPNSEENVDNLRAQVRELQAQLEQISGEGADMPPVQSGLTITAPSMGLQKEELDYAEVDECVADWRRATQNLPAAKNFQLQFQALYGDKYATGYRNNYLDEKASAEQSSEENDYDEVLPRPTNFHVVQQVGPDTLLVGWNYINPSVLDGFEVYLDDQVHERIYIPDRTKALISGLNLRKPIHLSICALSRYGQMSEPAVLELSCHPGSNARGFENEEDDEYKDFEDSKNKRPYSMEW